MIEFNPDGSLKLTAGQAKEKELEQKSIVISREQISLKPARAQIRIQFPEDIPDPGEIMNFYDKIDDYQFRSVDHSIGMVDKRTFIIKVDQGSMMMYGLLNFMIECFKMRFEQDIRYKRNVIVRGAWANF